MDKLTGSDECDVPIGCFDGTEICELVESFILSKLSNIFGNKNVGHYTHDGLDVMKQILGLELNRKRKHIIAIFKKYGWWITIQMNLYVINFLDWQFDLKDNLHRTYKKPNNDPIYISVQSKNPPQVLKALL